MFDFLNMLDDYEERKLDRYESENLLISTAFASDTNKYETAIQHPAYNNNEFVIVEEYTDKEQAQTGHNKWVALMTSEKLPNVLEDISSASVAIPESFPNGRLYQKST